MIDWCSKIQYMKHVVLRKNIFRDTTWTISLYLYII